MVPIPPPKHELQYRALGIVQGTLEPSRGYAQATLVTPDGSEFPATPGRVEMLEKFNACADTGHTYWFYVHPQARSKGTLGYGILKIMTDPTEEAEEGFLVAPDDAEPGFNLRGTVESRGNRLVVKVQRQPSGSKTFPPTIVPLQGYLPNAKPHEFWDLWAELEENELVLVDGTRIAQLAQTETDVVETE